MKTRQIEIPMPWGSVKGQIFGKEDPNSIPMLCIHGYLDNSNSFRPLAKYLTKDNKYYLIAVDMPGQGLSSKISEPMLYTVKNFILSLRKIILHLKLKDYIFLTHSFGCTLALTYLACFNQDSVRAIVLLDFVFALMISAEDLTTSWQESIEDILEQKSEVKRPTRELTYDLALSILLKANSHVDETAGKILLERSLVYENNKLDFSRDANLPQYMPIRYHYSEFLCHKQNVIKNVKIPILLIYAYPYAFTETVFEVVSDLLNEIKKHSPSPVELEKFDGSHHFHMMQPEQASNMIINFLNRQNVTKNVSNSKL